METEMLVYRKIVEAIYSNCFRLVLPVLIVLATACTDASHVKPLSDSPQESDPNLADTNKLIQQSVEYHNELKRQGLLYRDEEANQYINDIAQKLAPVFMKENDDLDIYITKDATANAASLPNGNIYLNIGLLSVVENEDQLAAIIGHEIGHVIYRHSLKAMLNRQDTRRAANIADIFLLGTGLGYIPAAGSLASYSRDQERQADEISLTYMHNAGYDVKQLPEVFSIFQTLPESLTVKNSVYSSHPDNKERVEYLEEKINSLYPGMVSEPVVSEVFNRTRVKIVETNVNLRLRSHQYELALYVLDQAEKYYNKAALIQYYRGEAYRLKAENPKRAADEIEWLASGLEEETEDDSEEEITVEKTDVKKDLDYFIQNRESHLDKAESLYNEAIEMNPDLALAHKGLGLLNYSKKNYQSAILHLNTYLEMAENPSDGLYVERLIRNSKKMEASHE